jgi:cell division protein FtsB
VASGSGPSRGRGTSGSRPGRATPAGRAPAARRPAPSSRHRTGARAAAVRAKATSTVRATVGKGAAARPRRTALTGRAAVLALVVGALVLSLAYPLRQYVEQRSEIAALEQEKERRTERVAQLERQKQRWQDPAYVKARARERLHFVMPGERGFVVADGAADGPGADGTSGSDAPAEAQPWYTRLWSTVEGSAGSTDER